jgi:hypothetical protein
MVKRSREASVSSSTGAESLHTQTLPQSSSEGPATPASSDEPLHSTKYTHLDEESAPPEAQVVMQCLLPPHSPVSFSSYRDYDVHYQKHHVNRCLECHKNFPSEHYLSLHIAENHDPLSEARRSRGEKTVRLLSC